MTVSRSERTHSLITHAPNMIAVVDSAKILSNSSCNVIISGETGTGKELIARIVHGGNSPFVVIDCTHLTEQLAERELFGNVRGAYTDARTDSPGLIEMANGGSAFFDEIGELPLSIQSKLLRLLQEKTFRKVGSPKESYSSFRVLAATNRDLKSEVEAGRFRADLYYRLKVAKIRLPPLRERKEDIPLLAEHFLRDSGLEMTEGFVKILNKYQWPGNVRELENCISSLVATARSRKLHESDLPLTIHSSDSAAAMDLLSRKQLDLPSAEQEFLKSYDTPEFNARNRYRTQEDSKFTSSSDRSNLEEKSREQGIQPSMREIEEQTILAALRSTGGNRVKASSLLRMSRSTFYRKIKAILANGNSMETLDRRRL